MRIHTQLIARSLFILAFAAQSRADVVKSCHDGDTCRFTTTHGDQKEIKVRFAGFDAPELSQTFGSTARDQLYSILKNKHATLECLGRSHKRSVCTVSVDGKDVGFEMVSSGLGWDSPKHSHGKFAIAQAEAKAAKRGVWGLKEITSPYCHRHAGKTWAAPCLKDPTYMP